MNMQTLLASVFLLTLAACQPDAPATQTATTAAPAASAVAPAVAPQVVAAQTPAIDKELQLAQASKCFSCHAIDRKLVGPAWKEVAAKYRGQKGVEAKLIDKVAKGGSGAWGPVPMPPNSPQVGDGDIRTLVHYILSLK